LGQDGEQAVQWSHVETAKNPGQHLIGQYFDFLGNLFIIFLSLFAWIVLCIQFDPVLN
jgi:hypothetical protein